MAESAENVRREPLSRLMSAIVAGEVVESSAIGFILYDRLAQIVDCNDAAASLFHRERSDLIGRSGRTLEEARLRHLDGSPMMADDLPEYKSLRERRPLSDVLVGIDFLTKPLRWAKVSTRLVETGGEVDGVVTVWVDCTLEIERDRMLKLGTEVSRVVVTSGEPSQILQSLCDVLVESGGYPLAWIGTETAGGGGGVALSYSAGAVGYLFDGIVSSLEFEPNGVGPTGTALRTQEIQIANDLATQPGYEFWRDRVRQFGLWSAVAIPFQTGESRVLTVYDRHQLAFDQSMILGIVEMTSVVSQQVRLVESLEKIERGLEGAIAALGQITEDRDPYTAGHQDHVAYLGGAIARALGLDERLVRLIELSGEVHDIGKVAVPAEILTKPGRLNSLEYEMVKGHCEVGAKILSQASLPWPIMEVAAQHHERLDGSGYPLGLKGNEIVMPARIIAVADVVEAMMTHRPYRAALGLDAALAEITSGRATTFDADVVDVCVALFAEGFEFPA